MTLRLHDTASRAVREFRPVIPGRASVYLCGATVQGAPHLGHLRSAVCIDILVRWLDAVGYQVTYCRNSADLDEEILTAAAAEDAPWWAFAERHGRAFTRAYELLGCRPPDAEPRGSGHVPDMIALITRLIGGGHAYRAGGDVYFDVCSAPGYGTLSGAYPPAAAEAGGLAEGRRNPLDFVLWRGAGPGEPCWQAPWGAGRPGRHLECPAISAGYLGATFDIHGGGVDLVFPHHENERAQALAAGGGSAQYWVHHGLVSLAGQKMSNSARHVVAAADALSRVRPQELRYYLGHVHYRSPLEYTADGLDEAVAAYRRIERFVSRAQHAVADARTAGDSRDTAAVAADVYAATGTGVGGGAVPAARLPISFVDAMDNDLSVPAALTAVHATVRDGNYALNTGNTMGAGICLAQVRAMLGVLGLDPLDPRWRTSDHAGRLRTVTDALVGLALRQREAARRRGDYASADSIRDALEDAGVVVEDTPEGPRWELAR